ncbi:sugar ABC transporter ATP-binding protein [Hungatella hathewayi]|uniref:sugar ABC transporter ATP-binding protein n=1 Tax=Hungatella hathewayi TaxID=154046 RepID=UPI0035664CCD
MGYEYLLEMNHIGKEYYGVRVLKDVSIRLKKGQILALLGENGAGKSTLMNILFGMDVIHSTGGFTGDVLFEGKPVKIMKPSDASELGIGMVHQEFMLIDGYEIAENIRLNREITKANLFSRIISRKLETVDKVSMRAEARKTLNSLGLEGLSETVAVEEVSVGYKQFVEIARELNKKNIKLVVLDEPTAVLTEGEAKQFLDCVRAVADQGISFIFISHRLDEAIQYADTAVVLRNGELVSQCDMEGVTAIQLSEMMIGRKVELVTKEPKPESELHSPVILSMKNFHVEMPGELVKGIDLEVREGEILGIGGLAGHGKVGIANGIMGLYPASGEVLYRGETLSVADTLSTLKKKIMFVSEDRRGVGLNLDASIEMNTVIAALRVNQEYLRHIGFMRFYNKKAAAEYAKKMIEEIDIRCTSSSQPCKRLSGGNQQKVSIAKALAMNPEVLFISEPTRGIDIGAKKLILNYLVQLNRERHMTIIMTSSELAELRSVCDRIAIVTEGKLAGILKPNDEEYKFGLLMSSSAEAMKEQGRAKKEENGVRKVQKEVRNHAAD